MVYRYQNWFWFEDHYQQYTNRMLAQCYIDQILISWPVNQKNTAYSMIRKYGFPNEVTPSMLIWYNNGIWKRTIIYQESVPHNFPKPHRDYLEQTIDYQVPLDMYDEIAKYDGSIIIYRTKGEISAKCDLEAMNFLALNLVNDIVTGKRSVSDARAFYAKTAIDYKMNKPSPYTQKLLFKPKYNTADPDKSIV